MAVPAPELMSNGQELTDEQLLAGLRDFYNFEPTDFFYHQRDFFARLERTDITLFIATTIKRFAADNEEVVVDTEPQSRFTATLTSVNSLMSSDGRELPIISSPDSTTAVIKMDSFGERFGMDRPETRVILPIDSDFHFDRRRRSSITYLDKWNKPSTHFMQAGVSAEDSDSVPRNSIHSLRKSVGFLISTIEQAEHVRLKKIERAERARKWPIDFILSDVPRSLSEFYGSLE